MSANINPHNFHGLYSNFGYKPTFSEEKKFADTPIHFFRASFAEKENDEDLLPKEFETEEEVFKWYKKNKYGESNFNQLEFPKDFCKNYLLIPESEFHKYRPLFHKMIKGLRIISNIEIESDGEAGRLPECLPCGEEAENIDVNELAKITYNQKIKMNIDFDSTKIFEIPELQNRLPANIISYDTKIIFDEDKNTEELIYLLGVGKKIFKDDWQFDQQEFNSIFENEKNKFNFNATFINDPVILNPNNAVLNINFSNSFNSNNFGLTSEKVNKQQNFSKRFEKFNFIEFELENNNTVLDSSSNSLSFNITDLFYIKNEKKYLCFIEISNRISFSGLVVDEEQECEICPESSSSSSSDDGGGVSPNALDINDLNILTNLLFEQENISLLSSEEDKYIVLGLSNNFLIQYFLTTDDAININLPSYKTSICSQDEKKIEVEKTKCIIRLLNNDYEIEIFKLKDNEFNFDNSECENLNPRTLQLFKNNIKINQIQFPIFEILEWKKNEINFSNIFPPKIS